MAPVRKAPAWRHGSIARFSTDSSASLSARCPCTRRGGWGGYKPISITRLHLYSYTHTHAYTPTHTNTHTHTHTHTHTDPSSQLTQPDQLLACLSLIHLVYLGSLPASLLASSPLPPARIGANLVRSLYSDILALTWTPPGSPPGGPVVSRAPLSQGMRPAGPQSRPGPAVDCRG